MPQTTLTLNGLEQFDGQLLNGLDFCIRAYAMLDELADSSGGIEELRLLTTLRSKRLIEEILPIAVYVQFHHNLGLRLRVRWLSGNQPYDACLLCSGGFVEHGSVPREQFLEVTTAVHPKHYLVREKVAKDGFAFGPDDIHRDRTTKQIISNAVVKDGTKAQFELADIIVARIIDKKSKHYPVETSLIVQCEAMLALPNEWADIVDSVRSRVSGHPFREIFLYNGLSARTAAL
jgi:hypothetical protein